MKKQFVAVLCAGIALSGCVATQPLREIAVDTNRLVADTSNDQTMLNILRAMDRMPMHFTSFSLLRGNLSLSGTAGLSMALPDDGLVRTLNAAGDVAGSTATRGVSTVTPTLSATVAANPNFDLAVYDTKQFQAGILTPVGASLIEYYLQRGWSEDLLTALFVARVDVTRKASDGTTTTEAIVNEPNSSEFASFIAGSAMARKVKAGADTALIPLQQFGDNLALADLALLDGQKYDIVTDPKDLPPGRYVARRRGDTVGITWTILPASLASNPTFTTFKLANVASFQCAEPEPLTATETERDTQTLRCTSGAPEAAEITYTVQIRSPEAILAFLGSYAGCVLREERTSGERCEPYALPDGSQVIRIARGSQSRSLLSVTHRNSVYSLPAPVFQSGTPDHRGNEAITIVQQLVNLQKSADTLPVSSSIQLVN